MWIHKYPEFAEIGDWVVTEHEHESMMGIFTKGTRVKITGKCERGYDIMDEFGHEMKEIGFVI